MIFAVIRISYDLYTFYVRRERKKKINGLKAMGVVHQKKPSRHQDSLPQQIYVSDSRARMFSSFASAAWCVHTLAIFIFVIVFLVALKRAQDVVETDAVQTATASHSLVQRAEVYEQINSS